MKKTVIKPILVLAAASSLSGCAMYRLEELRHTTPRGTPFQSALAKLYMDYATETEKGYDWYNSWHFADKGLMSAYGKEVSPEELADWDIPKEDLPYLKQARVALMTALTPQNEELHPVESAQAQFYFDCWVKEQDENWRLDNIGYCRDGLSSALSQLGLPPMNFAPAGSKPLLSPQVENQIQNMPATSAPPVGVSASELPASPPQPAAPAPVKAAAMKTDTISYIVPFSAGESMPTSEGNKIISAIAGGLPKDRNYIIVIKSAGNAKSVSPLFGVRAGMVKQRLIDNGAKAEAIDIVFDNKAKAVAAKAGHRVEVFINP